MNELSTDFSADRVVVLLSGGLDSATVAYMAKEWNSEIHALSLDYGQRHKIELKCARKIAYKVKAKSFKKVTLPLTHLKSSALTNKDLHLPIKRLEQEMSRDIPVTYVPGRNTIFLSYAASYAEDIGALVIMTGVNAQDYSGYPDCRPEFINKFNDLLLVSNKRGLNGDPIEVRAPIIHMRKEDIIKKGLSLGVPYEDTWSCYKGDIPPCRECDSCVLRAKGFREAGIEDPLLVKLGVIC